MIAPINQVAQQPRNPMMRKVAIGLLFLVIIGVGIATGYALHMIFKGSSTTTTTSGSPGSMSEDQVEVGKTYGVEDAQKYPDTAEGIIAKGGIDGEGTHHLVRTGGPSQTVYLTSSTVDLDLFENDKVQVRGETFSAQKAAWFMDVASVKVLEKNTAQPAETTVPAEE